MVRITTILSKLSHIHSIPRLLSICISKGWKLESSGWATMASHDTNGDLLMLEAPPQPSGPTWPGLSSAEVIDALPYIDEDYSDSRVKEEVDRLVEDEMRRSSKKPADFLKDLPPLPKFNFEVTLCFSDSRVCVFSRLFKIWLLRSSSVFSVGYLQFGL